MTAGYDCYPVLWSNDDSGAVTFMNKLDQEEKKAGGQHVRCAGYLHTCYHLLFVYYLYAL